jgi:dTDP-4-amino-4,6-dideoxygalactose transaminase
MNSSFDQVCTVQALLGRPVNPAVFPETLAFEAALCERFAVREAVAVSSGTAALHCTLAALGIGPGDEVLVPALAVIMSIVPVLYTGATPVFVDIAPGRIDFDYEQLESKITTRTKAILPVYLWGAAYTMPRLLEVATRYGLAVIEDACQAHGSTWDGRALGTWGKAGCFSMRDGKLMATGEGGFILTNDPHVADVCRLFRTHCAIPGEPQRSYQHVGHNYRLAEMLAWWGRHQVSDLEQRVAHRRWQTRFLLDCLGLPGITLYQHALEERPNGFSPIVLLNESLAGRGIAQRLATQGIANSVGTFGLRPAHEWPLFASALAEPVLTPHTHHFLSRVLAISLLPQYTAEDLLRIIHTIKTTLAEEQ